MSQQIDEIGISNADMDSEEDVASASNDKVAKNNLELKTTETFELNIALQQLSKIPRESLAARI